MEIPIWSMETSRKTQCLVSHTTIHNHSVFISDREIYSSVVNIMPPFALYLIVVTTKAIFRISIGNKRHIFVSLENYEMSAYWGKLENALKMYTWDLAAASLKQRRRNAKHFCCWWIKRNKRNWSAQCKISKYFMVIFYYNFLVKSIEIVVSWWLCREDKIPLQAVYFFTSA